MPKTRSSRTALIRAPFWLSVAAIWLLASPAMAEKSLTPHSAEYKVKISVLRGRLRTELRATDSGYEATHEIVATGISRLFAKGSIRETSHFAIAADGLLPTRYLSSDTLTRDKSRADLHFNWATGEVTGTVNDEAVQTILDNIVLDRVSLQYELMRDLLNGGPSEQYILFDIDKLKTLTVRIVGTKRIKVPAGSFDARVQKDRNSGMVESPTPQLRPFADDGSDLVHIAEILQRLLLRGVNTRPVCNGFIDQIVKMLIEFSDRAPYTARRQPGPQQLRLQTAEIGSRHGLALPAHS